MKCNVWVWCADPGGCEDGRKHKECWLKQQKSFNPAHITGIRGPSAFPVGEGWQDDWALAGECKRGGMAGWSRQQLCASGRCRSRGWLAW
jgi:hypothetical protein